MKYAKILLVVVGCLGCGQQRATTIPLDTNASVVPTIEPTVNAQVPPPAPTPTPGPAFPGGAEGKLLVDRLKPADVGVPARHTRGEPVAVKVPDRVEKPEPALPNQRAGLNRGELARVDRPVRPHLLADGPPLSRELFEAPLPRRIYLLVLPLVRMASLDVEKMQPLPYLSEQPAADVAATTDPTAAFSRNLALTTTAPARVAPAPFQRQELPDPFRDRVTVQLKAAPPEVTSPVSPDGMRP